MRTTKYDFGLSKGGLLRQGRIITKILLSVLAALCLTRVDAAGLKRVLILDFKNIEKNANYQYLEVSVTEAVRDMLKEKFQFREASREETLKFAEENLFFSDDFHTRSVAFQLGLLLHQDIVINGSFRVQRETIVTQVQIYDIGRKNLLTTFEIKGPASAQIFTSVGKIAERIAEECKVILPNKEEWQRSGGAVDDGLDIKPNQLSLTGGLSLLSQPQAYSGNISSTTVLQPGDFAPSLALSLGYDRNRVYKAFFVWGDLGYQAGKKNFSILGATQQVAGSLTFYTLKGGIGYELSLFGKLYLSPFVGTGYYLGKIVLDYGNLPVQPVVTATQTETGGRTLVVSAPVVVAGVRLGWQLNPSTGFILSAEYANLFYMGKTSGLFFLGGGVTFRL